MKYGLTNEEYEFLKNKIVEPLQKIGCKVFIFGSRANNTFKRFSDVDLFIQRNNIEINLVRKTIGEILELHENSNFPYLLDIVLDQDMASSFLPNLIKVKFE